MPQPNPNEPAEAGGRRVVVVLGMHRSGTSLVAGCLQRLGVDFGPRLMPPNADNPRGYFEHNDVVNLHDRVLLALNRSWDETAPFPDGWWQDERLKSHHAEMLGILRRDFPTAPWGLKDPRLCRLLPWWETLWPETDSRPLFILVRRRPAEVAASLARREGMSPAKSHDLWLRHTLEAEQGTRAHDRLLVDFSDFLADEAAALEPVRRALGLPASLPETLPKMVDGTLGKSGESSSGGETPPIVAEADRALRLGLGGDEAGMRAELDGLAERAGTEGPIFDRAPSDEIGDLRRQLEASRKQARWYESEWQKARTRTDKLKEKLATRNSKNTGMKAISQ